MKTINVIYVGDNFYWQSGTMMSSVYIEGTWERYDFGFMKRDLSNGISVNIRPANEEEMNIANTMLESYKKPYHP